MKKVLSIIALSLTFPVFFSCTELLDPAAELVQDIQLDNTVVNLLLNETFQLTAVVSPEEASEARIKWTSDDQKVATVKDGLITAKGKGFTLVIASAGVCRDTCYVTVNDENEYYEWTDNKQIYSLFKDSLFDVRKGYEESGHTYVRDYLLMSEITGDNVSMSGMSSDSFTSWLRLEDDERANRRFWDTGVAILRVANNAIEKLSSDSGSHELGECMFFRAIVNLHLATQYAKPYALGRDNPGIPLLLSAGQGKAPIAKVGEVYDQILSDLDVAVANLKSRSEVANAGVVNREAALALKARVLLYMEKYQECLEICNQLLGGDPSANLDTDLATYFIRAVDSKETLWCVEHKPEDSKGRGSIGSMYYSDYSSEYWDGSGWGEMYWTDALMDLFQRYPQDKRFKAYWYQPFVLNDGTKMIHWPAEYDITYQNRSCAVVGGEGKGLTPDENGSYPFTYKKMDYKAVPEMENGYPAYYIKYEGEKTRVHVSDNIDTKRGVRANGGQYPRYFNTKFSFQDGDPNLSSPVMIRWAEVILNRAEAKAKLGLDQEALEDVNIIRMRAGLEDALMAMDNYMERGYDNVLDVVLDERRMELCFEGHRTHDLIRNRKSIDRRYSGFQIWEVVNYDDPRLQRPLPRELY